MKYALFHLLLLQNRKEKSKLSKIIGKKGFEKIKKKYVG